MPPKKNRHTSVVVGTVSTRSTRRESIVNIQIVSKANKPPKSSGQKKPAKEANGEQTSSHDSTPKKVGSNILDILKDWSDDEDSQEKNIVLDFSSSQKAISDDQQSLIDILEGTKFEAEETPLSAPKIENPVVSVDSPKVAEPEVIEECVMEDDGIIVEYPEESAGNSNLQDEESQVAAVSEQQDIHTPDQEAKCDASKQIVPENLGGQANKEESESEHQESAEVADPLKPEYAETTGHQAQTKEEEPEETSLCQGMSELMQISKELTTSDELEDEICKMSIKCNQVLDEESCKKNNETRDVPKEAVNTDANSSSAPEPMKKIGAESRHEYSSGEGSSSTSDSPNLFISENKQKIDKKPKITPQVVDPAMEAKLIDEYLTELKASRKKSTKERYKQFFSESKMNVDSEGSTSGCASNDSSQDAGSKAALKFSEISLENCSIIEGETEMSSKKHHKKPEPSKKDPAQSSIDMDATIEEVVRKYTCEETELAKPPKPMREPKKKKDKLKKEDEISEEVRRSSRIKTIAPLKKKSFGLVKSKSEPSLNFDTESSDSNSKDNDFDKSASSSPQLSKSEKTKLRFKSSENLAFNLTSLNKCEMPKPTDINADKSGQAEIQARLKTFVHLKENLYKTDRQVCKEAREMMCDCYLAEEDIRNDEYGCGEDCLNRLLMIECGELCQVRDRCTNRRFQKSLFAPVEVFKTEKKGLGLRAAANIAYGEFILEYVGEVLNQDEFDKRAEVYAKDKNIHFYFMSLRSDAVIDATTKGNISRFINHSCDPNAETQKWTVNGELRIGFFSTRTILAGEEITFDYQFQRYGKEAQKCFCEATICRGWLGEQPDESEDEEEEEEVPDSAKAQAKMPSEVATEQAAPELEKMDVAESVVTSDQPASSVIIQDTPKKITKKKPRKEIVFDDFDQLNEEIDMLVTTGLKNQAHTLKLSRLMVRAKDLEQRKKLLRVLRRGELPCRRLFLDYHGLRLMHGYMIDAQQLNSDDKKVEVIQTKLELLQTLAVLPIQNKTMLIESKVLPAVQKWAKNEDIVEDCDSKEAKTLPTKADVVDPQAKEKVDEIKFLASKLLEEWSNLKEIFRIPKKERIEQMKEHEKEANRKFLESSHAQEKESSRNQDQRYRTWSRFKSERDTNRRRYDDKDRPSAEFLKISKYERRKLFALQMELREEERRLKQREMWRQHEMNCTLIGADPRFTAPFDPNKGFQYIWNPALGQWQALPPPGAANQGIYNSPGPQGVAGFNVTMQSKLGPYSAPLMNLPEVPSATPQYPALPPMVPGVAQSNSVPQFSVYGSTGINQPSLPPLPVYQDVKQLDDPSQVKFAVPIPPPVKLPSKWKCAKDKYGRPYYYHVKFRKSQWEPPSLPEPNEESSPSSSSETSSASSSETSSDSGTEDEMDDSKLLLEVKKQMETSSKTGLKSVIPDHVKKASGDTVTPSPDLKESDNEEQKDTSVKEEEPLSSIDIRLKEQFNLDNNDPPKKKRRVGLCQEIIISPRTEEDHKQFKEDVKRYKATKEKLKRQKEQMLQVKKKLKTAGEEATKKRSVKLKIKEMKEWNDEHAKKIKEVFRSTMATTVVNVLNAYRKPDCKEARITNTEDFKHLARKLTHFVMLKEIKHLSTIDELVCSDNVKAKAREYIRKYMSKFGDTYQKRADEPDFKD